MDDNILGLWVSLFDTVTGNSRSLDQIFKYQVYKLNFLVVVEKITELYPKAQKSIEIAI